VIFLTFFIGNGGVPPSGGVAAASSPSLNLFRNATYADVSANAVLPHFL
jgi:hypothetical protein